MDHLNNIDKHLEFRLLEEENNTINYLDLSIHRNTNIIDIEIYRKPTLTNVTIQFSSHHPFEDKFIVFNIYINTILALPITNKLNTTNGKSYL